jgi:hypothetical protein
LQSSKGAEHIAISQAPFLHAALPFSALQTVPQLPQVEAPVTRFASQPSAYEELQSAKPRLQEATRHAPIEHPAAPLATVQAFPQVPQLDTVRERSISQPSAGLLLQSPHPMWQAWMRQRPEEHSGWPLATAQGDPHAPQESRLESVLVSQPSL